MGNTATQYVCYSKDCCFAAPADHDSNLIHPDEQQYDLCLGSEDGSTIRVLSGLHAGERIVSSGGIFIND